MTYPRLRSSKRWHYGTPAWNRRALADCRRLYIRNHHECGAWWCAQIDVSLTEEMEQQ